VTGVNNTANKHHISLDRLEHLVYYKEQFFIFLSNYLETNNKTSHDELHCKFIHQCKL